MDIIRRNTDYALRVMVHLASHYGKEPVSARQIAAKEDISYQLACKLLQRLSKAGLVESVMGSKGGFRLSKKRSEISMLDVISAIQGMVEVNMCTGNKSNCGRHKSCSVHQKLWPLQQQVEDYLDGITLGELVNKK